MRPALWLAPASAALSRFLLFFFFGATCTWFVPASSAFPGLCFLLFSANCTWLGSTSPCLAGFLLFRFGATCAGFCSSAARGPGSRDARAGQQSGKRKRGQKFLQPLYVHDLPPIKLDGLYDGNDPTLRKHKRFDPSRTALSMGLLRESYDLGATEPAITLPFCLSVMRGKYGEACIFGV